MNCAAFEEPIARYVGGDLAPEDALAVEQHLRQCAGCAELARELESDRALLASRPPEAAEVDYSAMRREIRLGIARPRRDWKWLPAAAAAVLMAVAIAELHRTDQGPVRVVAPAPEQVVVTAEASPAPAPPKRVRGRVHRAAPPVLTLEDAMRMYEELEPPGLPLVPQGSDSPVEMRIATGDPNVAIILVQESKGDSQ